MNYGRILGSDPTPDRRVVSKLLLAIDGERPSGYYSLHFESLREMNEAMMESFTSSEHFDDVVQFISVAERVGGDAVPLPGPSEDWLKLLRQNKARLGPHSRTLDISTS